MIVYIDLNQTGCDGYLNICDAKSFDCHKSNFWVNNWPRQFFASVVDVEDRNNTCCFNLTSRDEAQQLIIRPNSTVRPYQLDVYNILQCKCQECDE